MASLTLYIGNKRYSSWSLRPWLFLKHHGLPFSEERVKLDTDEMKAKLAGVSPTLRVPALVVGAETSSPLHVWDSLAILEYLADTHGAGWPSDPAARATARCISAEMHSGMAALRGGLPFNTRRSAPRATWPGAALDKDVARLLAIFTQCRESPAATSGPWLFGEFSVADCMLAPAALRLVQFTVPALASASPAAQAYVRTVAEHPAVREWVAAGNAETETLSADEVD